MSDTDPLRGNPQSSTVMHLVNLIRPESDPAVQFKCAVAWHQGATAALCWTESNYGVYPGSLFPYNPYEIIEEETQ